jgi:hypothetical protein
MNRRTFLAGLLGTVSAVAAKIIPNWGLPFPTEEAATNYKLWTAPPWVAPGASLDLDFVNDRMWDGQEVKRISEILANSKDSPPLLQTVGGGTLQSFPDKGLKVIDVSPPEETA